MVIQIGDRLLGDTLALNKCGCAFAQLTKDGHRLVTVHGGHSALNGLMAPLTAASPQERLGGSDCDLGVALIAGAANKNVVERFDRGGLKALGMCGGDCGIFKLRGKNGAPRESTCPIEIAQIDSQWLDALCSLGITPVVASVGLTLDRHYCFTDPDKLASMLASEWKAHALIFLTDTAGVTDANGNVIRWLDLRQARTLRHNDESDGIRSKICAAECALRAGVRRVRIFPFADAELLANFYVSRIDSGTEIFEGSSMPEIAQRTFSPG